MTPDEVTAALAARTPGPWRVAHPGGPRLVYDTVESKMLAEAVTKPDARAIVLAVNLADPLWRVAEAARALPQWVGGYGGPDPQPGYCWSCNTPQTLAPFHHSDCGYDALRAALADMDTAVAAERSEP